MSAEILPFPSKVIATSESFEQVSHRADISLVDAFCQYADALSVALVAGPLNPDDRVKLIRMVGIISHEAI